MKLKKAIALILAVTTLLSVMTVSAFASTPIGETAVPINKRAEANCYITGALGSAESTGICGGVYDSWFIETGSPVDGKDGYNMNTWEDANDAITWTLSDGILTFSGTGGTARCMNLLFENNPHIEHIVIEEGITWIDHYVFSNLPNLETIIIMDASTGYDYLEPDVKATVDTIIIGANLKNNQVPEFNNADANSGTIILSNNIEWHGYQGDAGNNIPIIRNDATIYNSKNGDVIFRNGKMVETIFTAPAEAIKERTSMLPVNTVFAKAREALADVPASIIAKLPAELFAEHEEDPVVPVQPVIPVEPVKPTEPVIPEETIPETMTGTNDFTNSETRLRTSYNESNYVDLSVSGDTLTVSGRLLVDGLTKVEIKCGSVKKDVSTQSGGFFSTQLTLKHSGRSAVNVITYAQGDSSYYMYNRIYIEKTSGGYQIMPSLVQENNTDFEQSHIDPAAVLSAADVPDSVASMSRKIVGNETDDYTKVFLLHKWVAENIYYDYDAYSGRSQRITDSAGVLEARRSVCEGYSRLLSDLILAQGIPAMYCQNMSTDGSYAISTSGGELHAHAEAYVDGRWITMDATWDSNNKYRSGNYITKAPTGYYYFDISSEAFAMDHKITVRGGQGGITDENGFTIRPSDGMLMKYTGRGGNIIIPHGVTCIEAWAFEDCDNVTSVVIPEGVTEIGYEAFRGCRNLRSVTIPSSVTKIGYAAFIDCTSLKSVVIPDGVTEIASNAFNGCKALESVSLPKTLTAIRDRAFSSCEQLRSIVIPEGVKTIEYDAFDGCSALTEVTLPSSLVLTDQNHNLFSQCKNLQTVTLPRGIDRIPNGTFHACKNLTAISIPAGVTKIGYDAFGGCDALTDVYFGGTPEQWAAITVAGSNAPLKQAAIHCGETVISPEETGKTDKPSSTEKPETPVNPMIPAETTGKTELARPSMAEQDSGVCGNGMTWLLNQDNVLMISGTGSMTNFTLTADMSPTGELIPPVIVPWSSYADDLTAVFLSDGITSIGTHAFSSSSHNMDSYNFEKLTSVYIPASVTSIGTAAFDGCTALTDIYYAGSSAQWQAIEVSPYGNSALSKATAHYNTALTDRPEVEKQEQDAANISFSDVSADAYYAEAVTWAVENGITSGTSKTTFSPNMTCSNAHILTFLWHAAGSPVVNAGNTFTDVTEDNYYYQATLWAKSKGMVSGSAFAPNAPCNRASTVRLIWQAAGCPTVTEEISFSDVSADADYAMAVAWALENGVTSGTSATTFSPDTICTRAQIVTLLHHAFAA